MAKLKQINQDLVTLEGQVDQLAEQLYDIYTKYIDLLGDSVQRQLVLACYQLCTQTYPEAFLELNFQRRQNLQQTLQQFSQLTKQQFLSFLNNAPTQTESSPQTLTPPENPEAEEKPENSLEAEEKQEEEEENVPKPSKSTQLGHWYMDLEAKLIVTLQDLSKEVNQMLYAIGILPQQLPAKLLEAAVEAEEAGATVSGPPNILNILVEIDEEETKPDSTPAQICAIHLRLSEIEFADPSLNAERSQIRNLLAQLSQIHKKYQKKSREKAITEAEMAWRASWFES